MREFYIFMRIGFYDQQKQTISIGGIQTYMYDLAKLAGRIGYTPIIVEMNNEGAESTFYFDSIKIIQVSNSSKRYFQKCFDTVYSKTYSKDNFYIISTDQMDIKCKSSNVIAIQHGIAFDEPLSGIMAPFKKFLKCIKNIRRGLIVENTVCVDYNYYNWFRTVYTIPNNHKMIVIPNYSSGFISNECLEEKLSNRSRRKILFARRFVEHRGTILFMRVAKRLLSTNPSVEITFAGSGPLFQMIKDEFKDDKRVVITSFKASDSIAFHRDYDIVIIPTVFSEGTSLSLCEAMSAGCYPIGTCIGGITNIIIDGFNGSLTQPNEDDVFNAIKKVLDMPNAIYSDICRNAYNTAVWGFSKEQWEQKWTNFLNSIA